MGAGGWWEFGGDAVVNFRLRVRGRKGKHVPVFSTCDQGLQAVLEVVVVVKESPAGAIRQFFHDLGIGIHRLFTILVDEALRSWINTVRDLRGQIGRVQPSRVESVDGRVAARGDIQNF